MEDSSAVSLQSKKILGVRRNIFFLGLVSFFNDFSAEMVQSVMPVFLTVVLGAPAFFVGLIEGVADALSSVLKLLSGWRSDQIGKRKEPAVFGYGLAVAARILLAAVKNFWQVFGLRIFDRIGKGVRDAPRDALIAESVPIEELGRSFGFHRALDTLGATFGPLSAVFLLPAFEYNYSKFFLIASGLGLFAIFSFVFVRDVPRAVGNGASKRPMLDWKLFKAHKEFTSLVGAIFLFGLGAMPIGLVLLKAKEIGPTVGEVPLMYFVYSLAFVLTAVPLGRLADRIGERWVIAMGFSVAIVAYFGLAHTAHPVALAVFFAVLGIYSAATDSMQRVLAAKSLGPELAATGQGFMNMAAGFSTLIAGIVGGILWTKIGSSAAFQYAAATSLVGLLVFVFLVTKKHETK